MKITLDLTAKDFDHLTSMQMRWAGTDWKAKDGRTLKEIQDAEVVA